MVLYFIKPFVVALLSRVISNISFFVYCSLLILKFLEVLQGNSLMRILNIAAFAVSGYASTEGRICKPFNPLLGETYEADYPDKGLRFFSEKVFCFKHRLVG